MCWWLRLLIGRGRIKGRLKPLIYPILEPPFSSQCWEAWMRICIVLSCDYLMYLIRGKCLQACSGTCGQNGNQLGPAMEAEAKLPSASLNPRALCFSLWPGWGPQATGCGLIWSNTTFPITLQCCEVIFIYSMNIFILCWGGCGFSNSCCHHNKREEDTGPRRRGRHHPFFVFFWHSTCRSLIKKREDIKNLSIIQIIRGIITNYYGYLFLG